jgi:hypothetical protein
VGQPGCEPICEPSTRYCHEGDIYQCDATGRDSDLFEECGEDDRCEEYSNAYAACIWKQCVPGEQLCQGNFIKTCTAEAEVPTEEPGIDCGADSYCLDGACHARDCELDRLLCRGGDVYRCEAIGGAVRHQNCAAPATCTELEGGALCLAPTCDPGSTACVQNQVGTCHVDGTGLSSVSQDCGALGQVCDVTQVCTERATDVLGAAESPFTLDSGAVVGNVLDVHSDRRLLEVEASLKLDAAADLHWLVFEQLDELNFQVRYEQVAAASSGSRFFSSGPLDYTLEAGKHYLLAVQVEGSSWVADEAAAAVADPSFARARVSINGTRNGSALGDYSSRTAYRFAVRVTTELP